MRIFTHKTFPEIRLLTEKAHGVITEGVDSIRADFVDSEQFGTFVRDTENIPSQCFREKHGWAVVFTVGIDDMGKDDFTKFVAKLESDRLLAVLEAVSIAHYPQYYDWQSCMGDRENKMRLDVTREELRKRMTTPEEAIGAV